MAGRPGAPCPSRTRWPWRSRPDRRTRRALELGSRRTSFGWLTLEFGHRACLRAGYPVVTGARRRFSVHGMTSVRLTVLALAILAVSAVAGIVAYSAGVVDRGLAYGFSHDDAGRQTVIVAS